MSLRGGFWHIATRIPKTPHDRLEASLTENVMGLADITDSGNSPLDWVADEWHSAGFWMFPLALDPTLFGFHVHRPRIWMLAVPYDIVGDMSTQQEYRFHQFIASWKLAMKTE